MKVRKYEIISTSNNLRINKTGFCSEFINKAEADKACEFWNTLADKYNLTKATVKEIMR